MSSQISEYVTVRHRQNAKIEGHRRLVLRPQSHVWHVYLVTATVHQTILYHCQKLRAILLPPLKDIRYQTNFVV